MMRDIFPVDVESQTESQINRFKDQLQTLLVSNPSSTMPADTTYNIDELLNLCMKSRDPCARLTQLGTLLTEFTNRSRQILKQLINADAASLERAQLLNNKISSMSRAVFTATMTLMSNETARHTGPN